MQSKQVTYDIIIDIIKRSNDVPSRDEIFCSGGAAALLLHFMRCTRALTFAMQSRLKVEPCFFVFVYFDWTLTYSMLFNVYLAFDLFHVVIVSQTLLQLDTEEITVENAITHSFDKIVKLHLDPVWHQLSIKTKQLIADIKSIRLLLE